jgi:small subunit ribosomal protein S20
MHLTRVRTYVKRVQAVVDSGTRDENVGALLKQAVQLIDKAAQKGVIKRETASRKISRLTKAVASLS